MYFDSFDSIRSAIFQLKQRRTVCLCSRLRSADGKSNVDTCAKEVNREILAANQNRRGIESVFGHSFRFLWVSTVYIVPNGSFPDSQSRLFLENARKRSLNRSILLAIHRFRTSVSFIVLFSRFCRISTSPRTKFKLDTNVNDSWWKFEILSR